MTNAKYTLQANIPMFSDKPYHQQQATTYTVIRMADWAEVFTGTREECAEWVAGH